MDIIVNEPNASTQPHNTAQLNNNVLEETTTRTQSTKTFSGLGIVFCFISGCFFSLNSLVVKLITSVNATQMSFSRCVVQFCMILPVCTYLFCSGKIDILGPPGMFKFLVLRGLTGSTGGFFLYQAVVRLSLGDAVTIAFSNAVITSFLAYFILGEALTILDCVLGVFTTAGIVLISRPSFLFGSLGAEFTADKVLGLAFALGSALLYSITFILIRKLGKETPALLNVLFYSIIGSTTTIVVLAANNSFAYPCFHELPYVFVLGILGLIAQTFMVLGLHYERASTVAVLRTLQIVIVFILQVVVLHDIPATLSIVGSAIIFLCIFVVAIRKFYNQRFNKKKT